MKQNESSLLELVAAITDTVRCRILLLLERHELTVGELCDVLQLPQSTVSRHLKTLAARGWVDVRRNGTSHHYSIAAALGGTTPALGVWRHLAASVRATRAAEQDRRRLAAVLARRRTKSQEFFATAAGEWDRLRAELFGRRFSTLALLGLLDPTWVVGDLGCGTGEVSAALSPFVRRVVAVDGSAEMLAAARARLADRDNVELREGGLERLPLADAALDAAVLVLVLHHLPEPVAALAEAARVLRPGGRLVVVDMYPHDREEYRQTMGHVWLGFSEGRVRADLEAAGLETGAVHPLPPEADAKGPALFAATARRPERAAARAARLDVAERSL